jgi:hypothetical protein
MVGRSQCQSVTGILQRFACQSAHHSRRTTLLCYLCTELMPDAQDHNGPVSDRRDANLVLPRVPTRDDWLYKADAHHDRSRSAFSNESASANRIASGVPSEAYLQNLGRPNRSPCTGVAAVMPPYPINQPRRHRRHYYSDVEAPSTRWASRLPDS